MVEKGGTDEAFLQITDEVKTRIRDTEISYDDWQGAYFMPFKSDKNGNRCGEFSPEHEKDKNLYVANMIAKELRDTIKSELGYNASAGISFNKTLAKIASA